MKASLPAHHGHRPEPGRARLANRFRRGTHTASGHQAPQTRPAGNAISGRRSGRRRHSGHQDAARNLSSRRRRAGPPQGPWLVPASLRQGHRLTAAQQENRPHTTRLAHELSSRRPAVHPHCRRWPHGTRRTARLRAASREGLTAKQHSRLLEIVRSAASGQVYASTRKRLQNVSGRLDQS